MAKSTKTVIVNNDWTELSALGTSMIQVPFDKKVQIAVAAAAEDLDEDDGHQVQGTMAAISIQFVGLSTKKVFARFPYLGELDEDDEVPATHKVVLHVTAY